MSKPKKRNDKNWKPNIKLNLQPHSFYTSTNDADPLNYYYYPILGNLYRKRVEMCLEECTGGQSVLEVGFGAGLTFINLSFSYQRIYGIELSTRIKEVSNGFTTLGIYTELCRGNILDLPFPEQKFDTVLLISILEHLYPDQLSKAFSEIYRVLKPKGQIVYGVPVERPLMVILFRLLGYNIRNYHFSTERDVSNAAMDVFGNGKVKQLTVLSPIKAAIYEIGNFYK